MNLTIFDLDETLINVDSDVEWGRYLIDKKLVDPHEWKSKNERFYKQYKNAQKTKDTNEHWSKGLIFAKFFLVEFEGVDPSLL